MPLLNGPVASVSKVDALGAIVAGLFSLASI
jgi:hypothetical protein